MEDLHTAIVGRGADDTQFFLNDFTDDQTEVVILYRFDANGNYIQHKLRRTTPSDVDDVKTELFNTIKNPKLCDISVRPFDVSIDGETFGLVVNETGETVELQPHSQISFMEPWDGEYNT